MKILLIVLALCCSCLSFAQQQKLIYRSNGNVYNEQGEKFRPDEIRELLKAKPILLDDYETGRTKKSVGNFLLITGPILIVGDLARGLFSDCEYPTAMTYIGVPALLLAIPIKIGYQKKIRHAVGEYNKQIAMNGAPFSVERVALCVNGNGVGIQITF